MLEVFTQRNFVTEFIRLKSVFIHKMKNLLFEPPFGGLRGNVRTSSIARWKARGRLPIRDSWTFFASAYGWDVISRYWSKTAHFRGGWVILSANFRWKGSSPPTIVGIRKLECFATSQWRPCNPMFIRLDRVPACDRRTDRRTDGQTDRRTDRRADGIAVGITALCIACNAAAL